MEHGSIFTTYYDRDYLNKPDGCTETQGNQKIFITASQLGR